MAVDCSSDALIVAATCDQCAIPPGMEAAVQTYILDQIRIAGGGAVMTTDELIAAAKCYQCNIPPGYQGSVQIYLLCQIANA